MRIHHVYPGKQRPERIAYLLEKVGLTPEQGRRFPHELSGGQRQRVGIARALALNPKLIIGDEPVSALDVSIQAQIINLLIELQQEFKLSYLIISHDLTVVEYICDRIAVMYLGRIVEMALYSDLYRDPKHPYSEALISAIPVADPRVKRKAPMLRGDVPSPIRPPSGCHFHPRCPKRIAGCDMHSPQLKDIGEGSPSGVSPGVMRAKEAPALILFSTSQSVTALVHVGEPHLLVTKDVLDQLLQHFQAMIPSDDLGMHGQNECASRLIGALKFGRPYLVDFGRRSHAPVIDRRKSEHKMRGIIEFPRNRDFHEIRFLAFVFHFVEMKVIAHHAAVVKKTVFLQKANGIGT